MNTNLKPHYRTVLKSLLWLLNGGVTGLLVLGVFHLGISFLIPVSPAQKKPRVQRTSIHHQSSSQLPEPSQLHLASANEPESGKKAEDRSDSPLGTVDVESVTKVKKSSLPLEIVGISYGSPGFRTVTLRNLKSRKVRTLSVGDSWGQAGIRAIRRLEVQIKNKKSGQLELLRLNRATSSPGGSSGEKKKKARSVSRYQINKAIQSNMDRLLTNVEVTPALKRGQVIGFRIENFQGRPGELLKRLGFQTDDVITRVNGKQIDSMDNALNLWSSLKYQKSFNIQVLRNGKKKNLRYRLTR